MTTPTRLSLGSLTTPGSPPSEMSAPLSSLAISVPSVALSPSGEEEHPLLLSNMHQPHKSLSRDEQKRTSAHYNHGHMMDSLPPSPSFITEDINFQITGKCDAITASHTLKASSEELLRTNNNINTCTKSSITTNGHMLSDVESHDERVLLSESEECQGEHMPFLSTGSTSALLLRAKYGSRTNPASSHHNLQVKSFNPTTKQVTV